MKLPDRIGNHLDVRRRAAAATTDKVGAGLNDAPGIFSHVLWRAHLNLAAAHVSGETGVWLGGEFSVCERAHLLDGVEHDRGTYAAVQADDVGAPFRQTLGKDVGRSAEQGVAIHLDRNLGHDGQIAQAAYGPDRLMQFRYV